MAVRLDLEKLTLRADRVVIARMVSKRSYWGPSHKRILTSYSFEVQQDVAGSGNKHVSVVTYGGTVGRWTQRANGYPKFTDDSPVLLFLKQGVDSSFKVVGLCQGVFDFHEDDGRVLLVQHLEGLSFHANHGRPMILEKNEALTRIKTIAEHRRTP